MKHLADYKVGDTIDLFLLIKQATKAVTQKGSPYMTVILQDQTADVEAKLWETTEDHYEKYTAGAIVRVGGELHDYRGRTQLRVKSIRPVRPEENIQLEDLLPSAGETKEALFDEVTKFIFAIANAKIQRITRAIVMKYKEQLLVYPAASRNHHDYVSGLIEHTVSMLRLGEAMCERYPSLNRDLLYGGIILHDIGKVTELSGPIGTTYTLEGNLVGHISIMVSEIQQTAASLDIEGEEVTVLQHMVLSHHGKGEWGSPKPPMIREAEVLHIIDSLDAKMQMLDRALATTEEGTFSDRIFALDNRAFYKPSFS